MAGTRMTPDNEITRKAEADIARMQREHRQKNAEIEQRRRSDEAKTNQVTREGEIMTPKVIER